jgi:hypothetical protein
MEAGFRLDAVERLTYTAIFALTLSARLGAAVATGRKLTDRRLFLISHCSSSAGLAMPYRSDIGLRLLLVFLLAFPTACSIHKKMTVASAASLVEDVAKASYKQSDLRVIREGMPAYLMLMDGMVEAWPDNDRLLLAAAQSYSSYATAFVGDDDAAFRDALLLRAKIYALQALEQRGILAPLTAPFPDFEQQVGHMTRSDVPYVFWSASCWGSWISAHADSIAAVAELPRVETLMRRALVLDETYYYGGPHLFMGILYASRPSVAGGSLEKSQQHFLKAIEIGQGKFLTAYVYYADYYARKAFDRELFVSALN